MRFCISLTFPSCEVYTILLSPNMETIYRVRTTHLSAWWKVFLEVPLSEKAMSKIPTAHIYISNVQVVQVYFKATRRAMRHASNQGLFSKHSE